MLSKKMRLALIGAVISIGVAGCASDGDKGYGKGSHYNKSSNMASTQGMGEDARFSGEDSWGRSTEELLAKRTFRYGFDSFQLTDEDQAAVVAHAEYLASHPNKKVRVEGYTDERGSREYNIALGEKRAKSVTQVLISHGVNPSQITTVSYGEEKPEAYGHDENAHKINRRAVIIYN